MRKYHWSRQEAEEHLTSSESDSEKFDETQSPFPSRNDPALAAQAAATRPGNQSVIPSRNELTKENNDDNLAEESGDRTPLAGQYGHSGKLQTVDGIDQDMMDRIKFLAGITK